MCIRDSATFVKIADGVNVIDSNSRWIHNIKLTYSLRGMCEYCILQSHFGKKIPAVENRLPCRRWPQRFGLCRLGLPLQVKVNPNNLSSKLISSRSALSTWLTARCRAKSTTNKTIKANIPKLQVANMIFTHFLLCSISLFRRRRRFFFSKRVCEWNQSLAIRHKGSLITECHQ